MRTSAGGQLLRRLSLTRVAMGRPGDESGCPTSRAFREVGLHAADTVGVLFLYGRVAGCPILTSRFSTLGWAPQPRAAWDLSEVEAAPTKFRYQPVGTTFSSHSPVTAITDIHTTRCETISD